MKKEPLVLCLTNTVAANFTANCLLAIGAKPAMIEDASEAAELAGIADAMLVNLGTVTAQQADVMRAAIQSANAHGTPWVLDPVAIQILSFRRKLAEEFLALKPSLIRGNHAEIEVLRETTDNGQWTMDVEQFPAILSSGETDFIIPAKTEATSKGNAEPKGEATSSSLVKNETSISGGTPLLQSVTATGCAQGAICAAFLGRGQAPEEAALSASRLMKQAGERAAAKASTPGSFQIALLDALWKLTHK